MPCPVRTRRRWLHTKACWEKCATGTFCNPLAAVVGEDDREHFAEAQPGKGQGVLEFLNFVGGFQRCFVVQQEPGLEVAEGKIQRENDLAADTPDHGVHFDPGVQAVPGHVGKEVVVGPAEFCALGYIFPLARLPRLKFHHAGEVHLPGGQIALVQVAVHRSR